ncbi:hypothetical protein OROMI_008200 [Orobanche minor]
MEEFLEDQRRKCSHDSSPYFQVNKTMTLGKVELQVQAIHGALQKLQKGGTVKDAKAVCEPAVLTQMIKWKKKLAVYLAPFIHGVRYTSFGRHFTNLEKLRQVVNRLRWYAQDGDMIVDFSCGSNDFSCLMKEELDKMGKECSFKNYDIIQTKALFMSKNKYHIELTPFPRSFWGSIAEDYAAINPPTGFQGLISWLFLPAIAAGMYFDAPGEYLFIGAAIFTVVFCIIEMDKPSEPHNFEPQIYNMERGAHDKLISDYNTMDIWDFNEKYGDLWDFTIKKDNITKR